MAGVAVSGDTVRQPADWMTPTDDRILETMRSEGNMTPQGLANFGAASRSHASVRLSKLTTYGLVEKLAPGLYRLTDDGRAYLNEELDAAELDPVDDTTDD